jgi:hypothetical protein
MPKFMVEGTANNVPYSRTVEAEGPKHAEIIWAQEAQAFFKGHRKFKIISVTPTDPDNSSRIKETSSFSSE